MFLRGTTITDDRGQFLLERVQSDRVVLIVCRHAPSFDVDVQPGETSHVGIVQVAKPKTED